LLSYSVVAADTLRDFVTLTVNRLRTWNPSCLDLFLTPTVCLGKGVIAIDPKGIFQSATLIATTLL